jgi:hypothetical protein
MLQYLPCPVDFGRNVVDGQLDNPVPGGHVHSTDTHGFTEKIFAQLIFWASHLHLDSHRESLSQK